MNSSIPNRCRFASALRHAGHALPAVFLAAVLSAGPALAVRPETGNAPAGHPGAQGYSEHVGQRNLRKVKAEDLLEKGEQMRLNRLALRGEATDQVQRRLNALLAAGRGEVRVRSVQTDSKGNRHIRIQQLHRGYPVVGADAVIHVNAANEVYAVGGRLAQGLSAEAAPRLDAGEARARAMAVLERKAGARERQEPRLVIFDGVLAYETTVEEPGNPPRLWKTYVDASTGALLFRENRIIHAAPVGGAAHDVTGSLLTGEGGAAATVSGWRDVNNFYFLRNNTNLWGVYDQDVLDWSQNTTGNWGTADRAAVSLARNMELIQRYVSQVSLRNSYDDAGAFATAYVHEGTNYVNAYWDGLGFHFGDGDGITAGPLTVLDVSAHEYGHALTQYTSNLTYSYESGALNESYSDIYGALVEFWAQADGRAAYPAGQDGRADWLMGEDCWLSDEALRDMRNPQRFGQPSYYLGTNWYTGSGDNGGVHYNSGVQNFAFYLLAEGGTGTNDGRPYSIAGLGIEPAGEIANYANMYLLTSGSQYADAREAWILAASTLGHNVQTVRDVWTACGVLEQVNNLGVSPASLAFGDVGAGSASILSLGLVNSGANPTTVTGLAFDNAAFSSSAALPLTVAGGATVQVPVRFQPPAMGPHSGSLLITSNADDNPSITVPLAGAGVSPASVAVTPSSFTVSLATGESATRELVISNPGSGADLDWSLEGVARTPSAAGPEDASTIDILSWTRFTDMTGEYLNVVAAIDAHADPHTFDTTITLDPAALEAKLADKDVFMMPERELGSIPAGTGAAFAPVLQAFLDRGGEIMVHHAMNSDSWTFLSEAGLMQLGTGTSATSGTCVIADPAHPLMAGVVAPLSMLNWTAAPSVLDGTAAIATYNGYMVVAEKTIGRGRVIILGPDYYAYDTNWARILSNAVNLAPTATSNWLTASEISGSVPAGQSQTLTLSISAAALTGGSYSTDLQLAHNDPATQNPMSIPVNLEVDGYRRLAVDLASLQFGTVLSGAQRTLQLRLTNPGSEATTVSSLSTGHAEFSSTAVLPLVIQPFQTASIDVLFAPSDIGSETAVLTLTSDAEDNPTLTVALSGTGAPAPVLALAPASIQATLGGGETATRTVTVSNAGGVDLDFVFEGSDARILINEVSNNPDFIELWNQGADRNIGGWVLSWVDNASSSVLSFTFPAGYVLQSGRRVVVRENTGSANDSTFYAGANIGWVEGSTVSVALVDAAGAGVDFVRTTGSTTTPPAGTAWTGGGVPFTGVTAYRTQDEDTDGPDGWATGSLPSEFRLNPGQTGSGALPAWLSVSPAAGSVPPGASLDVTLTLNSAGMLGGIYPGALLVQSNDPTAPADGTPLPVELTVLGDRRLTAPLSLAFGDAWVGTQVTRTLVLENPGNEATTVTGLASDRAEFIVGTALPLTIPPFGNRTVAVFFAPADAGPETGVLTITSDAEDNPTLAVEFSGTGTEPPSATLAPDAFTLSLTPGSAPADRTATLSNVGGAPLNWRISSITQTGSPMQPPTTAPAAPAFAAAARPPRTHLIYAESNYAHPHVPGRVIVAFREGRTHFASSSALAGLGLRQVRELARAVNPRTGLKANTGRQLLLLELQDGVDLRRAIDVLRQDDNVAYAEPDYIQKAIAIPDDASFNLLYGMHNTGQSGGVADADIDAPEAWDRHTGNRSILIGVIDTGIDYLHPDLAANIWTNPGEIPGNGLDDDGNGYIDDVHGWDFANDDSNPTDGHYHGTHCAGTIAGVGDNGAGVAGVMWTASLVALKFLSDSGSGTTSDAIDAVNYANAMDIPITSNSWGGGGFSQALEDVIAAGGLFIAAAGNSAVDNDVSPHYPSSYDVDNIIAVAATDHSDALASFSCFGLTSVDLGAPGVNTYSTSPGNTYQYLSGTSMATPHVSGAAGLLWTYNPALTAAEVKAALMASVDPAPALAGRTVTGGRLNVNRALDEAGPRWLAASPTVPGVLAPGGSAPIHVTVDPAGLIAGRWTGLVTVATDDPAHPELPISVTADISGCRSLAVEPGALDFGGRFTGSAASLNLALRNDCNDTLTVSAASVDDPDFVIPTPLPIKVPPFATVAVPVEFHPSVAGPESGELVLTTDADADPIRTIALSGVGVEPPVATVNPAQVARTLSPGNSTFVDLEIGNTGGSDLTWTLSGVGQAPAPAYDASHFAPMGKGQSDSRVGFPVTEASGGPDAFGYRWTDSDEPGGPAYQWQDIRTTGSVAISSCDDCYATRSLSFPFPFYGTSYSQVHIVSNGYLTFGPVTSQFGNYPLPSTSMPANLVAGFFDDLYGGPIYFQDFGNRAVIQWQDVGYYSGSGTVTFQIVIHADGQINYYYQNMTGSVLSSTTGIQDGSRAVGLQVQYNTAYVRNQLAVRIRPLPEWLRVSEVAGTVPAGGIQNLALTLDATGLAPGAYAQTMTLSHNNPQQPPLEIPVTLIVESAPAGSRVLRVGPSAQAALAGSRFYMWNMTVGGEARGSAQGARYILRLK